MKLFTLFLVSFSTLTAANLEFVGYLTSSSGTRFVISDLDSRTSSEWLAKGESFHGFTVLDFDSKEEVLSLADATASTVRLHIKQSKVQDQDAALTKILRDRERRLAAGEGDQENVFASELALYSFRRDAAVVFSEKIKNQELIVSVHEKREARSKARRATGVVTDRDVLEKTEDLLREKVVLAQLRANDQTKKPNQASEPTAPSGRGSP